MKKLLTILNLFLITTTSISTLTACDDKQNLQQPKANVLIPNKETDEQRLKVAKFELQQLHFLSVITHADTKFEIINTDIKNAQQIKTVIDKNAVKISEVKLFNQDNNHEAEEIDFKTVAKKFTVKITIKSKEKIDTAEIKGVTIIKK